MDDFEALPGRGVEGTINSQRLLLGNHRAVHERGLCGPELEAMLQAHEHQGRTVTLLASEKRVIAVFAVADTIRATSKQAVIDLKALGVTPVMLTGDNLATAKAIASEAGNLLNHHAPLVLLTGRGMGAADAGTLQALAYAAMRQQSAGYSLALTFFGGFCLAVAHLLYRATFLPRALGPLMALAGVGYVVHGFASFLSPTAGARVFGVVALPCFLGELGLALWLLGRGVDVGRWEALDEARRATSDPIPSA